MASTVGRSISLATLVCLVVVWVNPSLANQCRVPQWQEGLGPNPMTSRRGKVVVVALLKAYCGFCIQQAQRLESMKGALRQEGYPDVDVIVVNGGDRRSRRLAANMVNATSLEVLQDRHDHVMYREIFRGDKDDFLVYDRCGQAVVYIPYPYSNLDYSVTKRVVKRIHSGQHSCYCSLDYPDSDQASGNTGDDVMVGDDPSAYVSPSRNGQDDVMMSNDPSAHQTSFSSGNEQDADDGAVNCNDIANYEICRRVGMGRFQTPRFPRTSSNRVEGTRFRPSHWNRRSMGMEAVGGSLGESTRRGSYGGSRTRRRGHYRGSRREGLFVVGGSGLNENALSFEDMLERESSTSRTRWMELLGEMARREPRGWGAVRGSRTRMAPRGTGLVEPRRRLLLSNLRPETQSVHQSAEMHWWTRQHGHQLPH